VIYYGALQARALVAAVDAVNQRLGWSQPQLQASYAAEQSLLCGYHICYPDCSAS
jgi:hypothetical protein